MKRPSKIQLNRETVRSLTAPDLRRVAGGEPIFSTPNGCTRVPTGGLQCTSNLTCAPVCLL